MKKPFSRLIPLLGVFCLPLFGGYSSSSPNKSLLLDDARLHALDKKVVYQASTVTREYLFTLLGDAPREGLNDIGPLLDYRFFTRLTNFLPEPDIQRNIVARTQVGQDFLAEIRPGRSTYWRSTTYPGYGRFFFNAGQTKVHNFYGRQNPLTQTPWPDVQYLEWVRRDLLVRATGMPAPGSVADPAGW